MNDGKLFKQGKIISRDLFVFILYGNVNAKALLSILEPTCTNSLIQC